MAMRVLLLNLGTEALRAVDNALSAEGYEIVTEHGLTVDQVLTLSPEVLVTEATPSDLSCCGLISQLKSRPDTRPLKILMVVQGGALERARALDLGDDDVISFPFDAVEFASRFRTQFRDSQPDEDIQPMMNNATQRATIAYIAEDRHYAGAA